VPRRPRNLQAELEARLQACSLSRSIACAAGGQIADTRAQTEKDTALRDRRRCCWLGRAGAAFAELAHLAGAFGEPT